MKRKLTSLLLAAVMLLSLLTACSGQGQTPAESQTPAPSQETAQTPEAPQQHIITDMLGREVVLPDEINTIATFKAIGVLNTFVETLGAGDKICNGMTPAFTKGSHDMQYVFAPQIKGAPVLENADGDIQIEDVLALNPDLCLVAWKDNVEPLEKAGLCVVYVNWTNGEELKEAVTLLGDVLGAEDKAAEYCEFFDDTVARAEALTADIPDDQRVTALYGSALNMKNPHKISEWWIPAAGGISVTDEIHSKTDGEAVEFTMEDLLAWNPDVMFLSSNEKDDLLKDPNYAGITAVKNEALYKVPTVGHSWGNRSTEQPLVILWGMSKMYPDLYTRDELAQDVAGFYHDFFHCDLTDEQISNIID